jgi:thioredoxin-related protein
MKETIIFLKKVVVSLSLIFSFSISADIDLDKIILNINHTNKNIILFLHKDGCGFCERMLFDLDDENLSKRIEQDFILVDINRDDNETISFKGFEGTNRKFLKELGVTLYPTIAFIDNNSTFIYNIIGYRNPKKFITVLNYISSGAYKKITMEEFEDESLTNDR